MYIYISDEFAMFTLYSFYNISTNKFSKRKQTGKNIHFIEAKFLKLFITFVL